MKCAIEESFLIVKMNRFAVPDGKCRIRFSVTAAHTDEDINHVLEILNKFKI